MKAQQMINKSTPKWIFTVKKLCGYFCWCWVFLLYFSQEVAKMIIILELDRIFYTIPVKACLCWLSSYHIGTKQARTRVRVVRRLEVTVGWSRTTSTTDHAEIPFSNHSGKTLHYTYVLTTFMLTPVLTPLLHFSYNSGKC